MARRIYWSGCSVCQYEKRNPELKRQVNESRYVNPLGKDSLMDVWKRFGMPFSETTIYSHMQRHRSKETREVESVASPDAVTVEAEEGEVISQTHHERGLDEIIAKGRNMLRSGELRVTTQSLLVAIRTKAEIEKANKDRNLDAMKMMAAAFKGTDPKDEPPNEPPRSD